MEHKEKKVEFQKEKLTGIKQPENFMFTLYVFQKKIERKIEGKKQIKK